MKPTDTVSLSSQSSSEEEELISPTPRYKPKTYTALQVSILQILVPCLYAATHKENILAVILGFVIIVGLIVHRPERPPFPDAFDLLDHMFIGAWLTANAYIGFTVEDKQLQIFAILCALLVIMLAVVRVRWPKYSLTRIAIHVLMHFAGAFGTMIILYGSKRNSYP